ncbi:MAG: hypothetical protein ABSB40_00790 [Nitrososphaeria archaeon]|jgi:hypothetical protein
MESSFDTSALIGVIGTLVGILVGAFLGYFFSLKAYNKNQSRLSYMTDFVPLTASANNLLIAIEALRNHIANNSTLTNDTLKLGNNVDTQGYVYLEQLRNFSLSISNTVIKGIDVDLDNYLITQLMSLELEMRDSRPYAPKANMTLYLNFPMNYSGIVDSIINTTKKLNNIRSKEYQQKYQSL